MAERLGLERPLNHLGRGAVPILQAAASKPPSSRRANQVRNGSMGGLDLKQERRPSKLGLGEEFARPIPIRNPIAFDGVIWAAAGQTNGPRLQRASAASSGRTLWP